MKLCPQCKTEYPGGEIFCPVDGARLQSPSELHAEGRSSDDPLIGTTLAERYRVIRRIGEGGMGLVYEAEHAVIEKRVALKLLREDFSSRPEVVQRFQLEAKSASRIGHEHIVDISDFGTTPSGASYFVMEFLEGEDLANVLAREATLPVERVVGVLLQCCRALGAAHAKGIVHRDMKPENIFLTKRGENPDFVKLVDFGIAKMSDIETDGAPGRKLTKTGMIFGTPEYMSPEQAAGKKLDHRVDIYAVGVILYECLTGRVPFVGDTFMGVLTQHMFDEPPAMRDVNPGTTAPPELEHVIYKALSKSPDDRYQSMDELHDAMVAALEAEGMGGVVPDPSTVRAARSARTTPRTSTPRTATPRASTLRTDTEELPEPEATKVPKAALVGGAAALFAAAFGFWLYARSSAPNDPPTADSGATTAAVAPADPEAIDPNAALDGLQPTVVDAGPPPGPKLVALLVETRPSGATVRVEDESGGEPISCDPTPCTIEAPVGEPLVLRAERGRSAGEEELTPTEDGTVRITLRSRPSGRPSRRHGGSSGDRPSNDLKIPEIFR